jgi:plasmid replication initiation protein
MAKHNKKLTEVQSLQTFKDPSEVIAINTVKLTEVQLKTWLAMLYHSRNSFRAETHEISIKELKELSGYAQHDLKYLKDAMFRFCQTVVSFNTLGKSKKSYGGVITCLLAGANFDKKPGFVEYQFSVMLKDIVENSKMFGNLSLTLVRNIETKAALALYRVMNDYRGIRTTPDISLKVLREILGVDEGEYIEFKAFNQWVLKPACKHIKQKTDLEVIPLFTRSNRKVSSVRFQIKEQNIPLIVRPKLVAVKNKKQTTDNPYSHLTFEEATAELERIHEHERETGEFTVETQKQKAMLNERLKAG